MLVQLDFISLGLLASIIAPSLKSKLYSVDTSNDILRSFHALCLLFNVTTVINVTTVTDVTKVTTGTCVTIVTPCYVTCVTTGKPLCVVRFSILTTVSTDSIALKHLTGVLLILPAERKELLRLSGSNY